MSLLHAPLFRDTLKLATFCSIATVPDRDFISIGLVSDFLVAVSDEPSGHIFCICW